MFIVSEGQPKNARHSSKNLLTLSKDGVGLRRNEGFGTVIISDDFHRQFCNQEERA